MIRSATLAAFAVVLAFPLLDTLHRTRQDDSWRDSIEVVPPEQIGRMVVDGRRVVLVDVREPAEYAEFHLPGAVSVPLRDLGDVSSLDPSVVEALASAEVVVPYCLKDFRGYEGARRLKASGVDRVALMEGFGVNSWKQSQLPLAGPAPYRPDAEVLAELTTLLQSVEGADN